MSHGSAYRRSAREWAQLVREWKRSGLTAGMFAEEHGLSACTLAWWRWKLARDRRAKQEVDLKQSIELVRVQVDDTRRDVASTAPCAWELVVAGRIAIAELVTSTVAEIWACDLAPIVNRDQRRRSRWREVRGGRRRAAYQRMLVCDRRVGALRMRETNVQRGYDARGRV